MEVQLSAASRSLITLVEHAHDPFDEVRAASACFTHEDSVRGHDEIEILEAAEMTDAHVPEGGHAGKRTPPPSARRIPPRYGPLAGALFTMPSLSVGFAKGFSRRGS